MLEQLRSSLPATLIDNESTEIFPNKNVKIDPMKGTVQDQINSWKEKVPGVPTQSSAPEIPSPQQQVSNNKTLLDENNVGKISRKSERNTMPTPNYISCDSLLKIESVTGADLNDIERFKDMLAKALLSVTEDTELD